MSPKAARFARERVAIGLSRFGASAAKRPARRRMPPSAPPRSSAPPGDTADKASILERVGTAAFTASCAAVAASFPAALRIAPLTNAGTTETWLALAGTATPLLLGLVLMLRKARAGIRAFAGAGADARLLAAAMWLGATVAGLVALGSFLRATTHHHALAGVTFAVVGLTYGAVLVPFAIRLAQLAESWRRPIPEALAVIAVGAFLIGFSVWIARFTPSVGSPPVGGELIDGLAVSIAALFAARKELANHRILSLLGPPLGVALLVAGVSVLRTNPALVELTRTKAPLLPYVFNLCSR